MGDGTSVVEISVLGPKILWLTRVYYMVIQQRPDFVKSEVWRQSELEFYKNLLKKFSRASEPRILVRVLGANVALI